MRLVRPGGQEIDVPGRTRLNDAELRRARDLSMLRMRRQGYSVAEVARFFRVTPRYVFMRLAAVPATVKARAEAV